MPQQTDFAKRTRLCRVSTQLTGRKVRVAGRLLTYDLGSGLAVLLDGPHGLLVDLTLVLDAKSNDWAHERLTTVTAIGHLEALDVPLQSQIGPTHSVACKISQHLILRAILVVASSDLDLGLWNAVLMEEEEEEKRSE